MFFVTATDKDAERRVVSICGGDVNIDVLSRSRFEFDVVTPPPEPAVKIAAKVEPARLRHVPARCVMGSIASESRRQ